MFRINPRLIDFAGFECVQPLTSHLLEVLCVDLIIELEGLTISTKLSKVVFFGELGKVEKTLNFGKSALVKRS